MRLIGKPPQRMTPARRRLIDLLSDGLLHGKSDAAKEAGVSVGVVDGLVDEGTLTTEAMPRAPAPPAPDPSFAEPDFSRQQRTAVDAMRALAANGSFHVALLDGVTGSGKTEVYFEAIAEVIRRGRQSLILMPEIALTGQFLDRFAQRFGVRPLEWHSGLTPRTRARNWAAIAAGEAPVGVGARSALFLPYANLGLIIVDEEHDQAYKQDEGAHYHARDMAVVRAHHREDSDCAGLGDGRRSRPKSMRARGAISVWCCRRGSAASTCRISRRSICAARARYGAASSRRLWPRISRPRSSAANRRFCFSIAAVTRR